MSAKIGKNINKQEKDTNNKSHQILLGIITAITAIIVAVINNIIGPIAVESVKMKNLKSQNYEKQCFYNNKTNLVERSGIEYTQYKITSNNDLSSYHVIVYPYIEYEQSGNEKFIPIEGQFTQTEYVANEDGDCLLLRENSSEELMKVISAKYSLSVDVKCLVAIQYVEDENEKTNVYNLRDGQLTEAGQDTVIEVLEEWYNKNNEKIDMRCWPSINGDLLNNCFKNI